MDQKFFRRGRKAYFFKKKVGALWGRLVKYKRDENIMCLSVVNFNFQRHSKMVWDVCFSGWCFCHSQRVIVAYLHEKHNVECLNGVVAEEVRAIKGGLAIANYARVISVGPRLVNLFR